MIYVNAKLDIEYRWKLIALVVGLYRSFFVSINQKNGKYLVRKVKELNETMPSTESALWNLTIDDCKALFPFQPVNVFNNACICDEGAVFNGIICGMLFQIFYSSYVRLSSLVFTLGFSFIYSDHSMIQCPKNANSTSGSCQCSSGYKQINNTTCGKCISKSNDTILLVFFRSIDN